MIIAKAGSAVTAVPVDGVEYTASRTFGNGTEIAPGEFVVYNGSGSIYETLLNLQPRTTYHFKVFEYNGSGTETYYLTTVDGNGNPVFTTSQSTLSNPTVQASNLIFSNVEFTKMKASWTNGDGSSRILIARANSPVDIEPQDLVTYNAYYAGYGNPYYEIGTGNYVLYSGTGSSVNITHLDPGTTYHFALFEYTGNYGRLYQTASSPTNPAPGATASQATNGYTSPTENATGMNFRSLDGNRFIFDMDYYTANQSGNGEKRMIIAKAGSAVTAVPVDGVEYTASRTFGNGTEIAPGEFVVYNGSGSIYETLLNLQPRTTYHFKVFEYNGSGTETYYLTTVDGNGNPVFTTSQSTLSNPTVQASNLIFSNVEFTKMKASWTNGDGSSRILIARANSPVDIEPQDLVTYNAYYAGYGNPYYEIGTGNYVLYSGTGSSVNITNLDPGTTYHFALFEYTGNYGRLYQTASSPTNPAPGATASQATNGYTSPTENATGMNFRSLDGNRFIFDMDYYTANQSGNGEKRMIIAKAGSAVTAVPVDGVEYTASRTFGNGTEIASGEFVVYNGSGSIYETLLNLQPRTTYHFKVFEYNGSGTETYYLTTVDGNGNPVFTTSQSTLSNPTVQTNNIFINSKTTSSFNVNWTSGNGSRRILLVRENEPVDVEPQDLMTYPAYYAGYGQNYYQIGTGNYAVYDGGGISVNVTNLQPGTNYHFALFEYNGSNGKLYLRPGYTFEAETYGDRPTQQVTNARFEDVGATSMKVKFTRGSGSARMVIARKGSAVNKEPADLTTYLANTSFGQGQNLGDNNYVVYNGTAEEFILTNLEPSSDYHFAFFEYAINQEQEYYVKPGLRANQLTPSAPGVSPSNFAYSRPCDNDLVISWDAGDGQGRLVIIGESPLNSAPINGTNYNANFGYGLGDAIGNGYVIYNGSGNMVPPNLLQPSTNYYVNIYEYNGTKTDPVFNMTALEGFIGDISVPNISCRNIQIVLDENGNASITPEDLGTIPAGDCGVITAEIDISDFDCSHLGANNVTLTITDENNNSSSCVSVVTVVDQTPPTVITKNISVQLDANGTVSIAEDAVNDGSTDACGPLVFSTDITNFNSSHIGENTVTLTVTDGSNNSSSATAIVTVLDVGAPVNDDLCNAITLTVDVPSAGDAYTNVGATAQMDEPTGSCWNGTINPQTVWFSFEAPSSGNVIVSTDIAGGSLANTHFSIYEAPSNCNDFTTLGPEIACDENGGINYPNRSIANLTNLTAGNTYYIQVDGNGANTGTFGIEVTNSGCLTPSNLLVDGVTGSSANVSWTGNGNESSWIVKYSENSNFDPQNEGMSSTINSTPTAQLIGLNSNTNYTFYVKADCGNGDQSSFGGPKNFTTLCSGTPTLTFLGSGEFENSIVTPTQGTPETTYEFAIVYTNEAGELPPYGFPRVLLDFEGNGRFTDTNDRAVVLSPADVSDLDTTDGKIYVGSISQLPSGTNWQATVQVQSNGCITEVGPYNVPQVLTAPDLEIFANDIVFDNMNPDVSSPLEIKATIHNKSDFAAQNFVVHLENQFDITAVYPDIIVDYLEARESTTVTWNIITPSIPSWNPMEVFVDYTNVIIETNELNNRAMRPFTNGDFNVPGAINVQASASPSVIQLPSSNENVTVSGYAYYTDTAVQLQDSTVAGATVTFISPVTGGTIQTHTNSRGYFSFRTRLGTQPGVYTAPVEVTDFTITGETPITWELIQGPCLPDLVTRITPSYSSIIMGQSVSGTITVTNRGCAAVEVETLLEMDQTGGLPIIVSMTVPPLGPGESFSHPFTAQFNTVGTYYITGLADASSLVVESSENNNLGTASIRVNPPLPDIVPIGSGGMNPQYLCTASNTQSFGIRNIGFVATGSFDNTIDVYFGGALIDSYVRTVQNIEAGRSVSVSIPVDYQQLGRYSFVLNCDVPDMVLEIDETNNGSSYYLDIIECRSDLYVSSSCNNLVVDPVDLDVPGTVTYTAEVGNGGNATALAPVHFEFRLSNGEVYPLVYNQDILPGERVTFSTSAPSVSSGGTTLTAVVDPNNLIDDKNRNNNSTSGILCWEFEPVPLCGYNFWNTIYHENESALPTVGVKVKHLYRASEVKVRFEVKAPGDTQWAFLGDTAVQNVNGCQGCPYYAALPARFVFNENGVYTFRMTTDPDNDYDECNEANNVLIKEVHVQNKPDMRILSQHINPTLLNPEPGEYIFFDISYENIGYSNINDRMDLTLKINNDILAVVNNVPGLIKDRTNTIAVPIPYSSEIEGLHVARAIIDSNHDVNDANRLNNEATRSFVVGAAANLKFNEFYASNETPEVGETIDIDAFIANDGELDVDAEVLFSYISAAGDTISIGTRPVNVPVGGGGQPPLPFAPGGGQNAGNDAVSIPWTVVETPVRIVGEIINSSELEFDYTDNFAYTQLNNYNVSISMVPACEEQNIEGSLTALAGNGTAPYSYYWSNGYVGEVLEAGPGTYSVTVIDARGKRAVSSATIEEDPDCIVPACSLSAVSFNVPSSCNPNTGVYTTTVVVTYENPPTQGSISVNGTNYPITGSPQTFQVDFYSGPVVFNIYFTDNDNCNLTIPIGITLEECEQDCEGIYGGTALPGAACLDANDDPGILDGNCECEVDVQPTCTSPELTLAAQDANGEPIGGCIEAGGSYYVLAALTGGSGNSSYSVTANNEDPITVNADESVILGPFTVGVDVSVIATGIDDATCGVSGTIDSPDVCPPACTSPELTLAAQDADGEPIEGCIEASGSYYVFATLTGGSGNSSYTVTANTEDPISVNADESVVLGPFPVGTDVSVIATGIDNASCEVTGTIDSPDVCPPACTSPELSLAAQDADGEPIQGCIEAGSSYFVLATLTGGSGNSSYTVTANSEDPITVNADESVVLGPFTVGTDVSVIATGDDDGTCGASASIDSPALCGDGSCEGPDAFVTTWTTTASGESITIPTYTSEYYDYTVDWGDGNSDMNVPGNISHTYANAGTYTVSICGTFPRIYFNNSGDRLKIKSIEQWGTNAWSSMNSAFMGAENLVSNATDMPDLSMVSDMYGMFAYARKFNGDANFGNWNVGNVTDMKGMFGGASVFNYPIGGWNVGNVTDMESMFHGATLFNQNIGSWDVSSVTTMKNMFNAAMRFNQDLSNWDVGNVSTMNAMFFHANSFDQNIGGWNVSNVTDMANMFRSVALSTANYDALLNGWNNLSLKDNVRFSGGNSKYCAGRAARNYMTGTRGWTITDGGPACAIDPAEYFVTTWKTTVPNETITLPTTGSGYDYVVDWGDGTVVTNQTGNASHSYSVPGVHTVKISGSFPRIYFNNEGDRLKIKSIEQWGTNIWSSMNSAFMGCENLVSNATDLPNVSLVTDMYGTFAYARKFKGDANFGNWNVGNVTNMKGMFAGASVFNYPIGTWNVGKVTDMESMFHGATLFNKDVGSWNVSNVTTMKNMFNTAMLFNQDIGNWNVDNVGDMNSMFFHSNSFDQDLGGWNVANVDDMANMFRSVTLSIANYDALLNGWSAFALKSNVKFHGGNSKYCVGEPGRLIMIGLGWIIQDGGMDCSNPFNGDRLDVGDNVGLFGVSLYPNPMKDQLNLGNPKNVELESISIFDLTGRMVQKVDLNGMTTGTVIDVSRISSATYLVLIKGKAGQTTELLIKE